MSEKPEDTLMVCNLNEKDILTQPLSQEEIAIIDEVNDRISSFTGLQETLDFVFTSMQTLLPSDIFFIGFFEEDRRRIMIQTVSGNYESLYIRKGITFDIQGTILDEILDFQYPLIISDIEKHLAHHPHFDILRILVKEKMKSAMICPMKVEDRPVGIGFRGSFTSNNYSMRSITRHNSITKRLSQAVEKTYIITNLERTARSYMEMLGFVSHELKSPINSIITLAKTIEDGYFGSVDEGVRPYIQRMIKKAEYLRDISNEYLTLSRFESQEVTKNIKTVNFMREILEEMADIVKPQAEEKKVSIEIEQKNNIPYISCDPLLMRIVMGNLLSNAVKYSYDSGTVKVTLRMKMDKLIVSVWNSGPGFSDEHRNMLFKKFSRIDKEELMSQKGTGVGLYITWKIIQLHKGRIWAGSSEGKWAEFSFEIPFLD